MSKLSSKLKFNFDNTYVKLPKSFYRQTKPSHVTNPKLSLFNQSLAEELFGQIIKKDDLVFLNQIFSGNEIAKGSEPISQAYSGHQFAHFVPLLGDGRAILLGEVLNKDHKRYDIQLKGSGKTDFSRGGDGKAPLGPMIREYLVSEAMQALGVPTTRSLALVTTEDVAYRETELSAAVLTRVASSHIRVGTFEFFASRNDLRGLKDLTDYTIDRHYPVAKDTQNIYLSFLKSVIKSQAQLISKWMSLGFIHGVMNTDNMTVSGETIDYGPCAFMDAFDPGKVFSSIDRRGRYAYNKQPDIAKWNLSVLASCLMPLIFNPEFKFESEGEMAIDPDKLYSKDNVEIIQNEIDSFDNIYRYFWLYEMKQKLGFDVGPRARLKLRSQVGFKVESEIETMVAFNTDYKIEPKVDHKKNEVNYNLNKDDEIIERLIQDYLNILATDQVDFTLGFRYLSDALTPNTERFFKLFKNTSAIEAWLTRWKDHLNSEVKEQSDIFKLMNQKNPIYIPRNHLIEKAINLAQTKNDFSFAKELQETLLSPYQEQKNKILFSTPAKPEEEVTKTFCGT